MCDDFYGIKVYSCLSNECSILCSAILNTLALKNRNSSYLSTCHVCPVAIFLSKVYASLYINVHISDNKCGYLCDFRTTLMVTFMPTV